MADDESVGGWLRLTVDSPDARTWWPDKHGTAPTSAPVHGSVVLDETAARALRDQLTDWLDTPKTRPTDRS